MEVTVDFTQLCPFVREVGLQRGDFWQIPRRIYDYELMLCISGSITLTIGESQYRLAPNHLAIIPPNTPHKLYDSSDLAELIWIHFDFFPSTDGDWIFNWYNSPQNYARCFSEHLPYPEHIRCIPVFPGGYRLPHVVAFQDDSEVKHLFLSLVKTFSLEQNHFLLLSRIVILRIIDAILDQDGYWHHSAPICVSDIVIQYIKANYKKNITMNEICSNVQYSTDYVGKLFKKETGNTVIEFLQRFRVNKAQSLLLDETLSVATIAEMCGFQSINYFSRVTRKLTGKSPRELRAYLLTIKNDSIPKSEG